MHEDHKQILARAKKMDEMGHPHLGVALRRLAHGIPGWPMTGGTLDQYPNNEDLGFHAVRYGIRDRKYPAVEIGKHILPVSQETVAANTHRAHVFPIPVADHPSLHTGEHLPDGHPSAEAFGFLHDVLKRRDPGILPVVADKIEESGGDASTAFADVLRHLADTREFKATRRTKDSYRGTSVRVSPEYWPTVTHLDTKAQTVHLVGPAGHYTFLANSQQFPGLRESLKKLLLTSRKQ